MNRTHEIRRLLNKSPQEIMERNKDHLHVVNDLDALYLHFAREIYNEIVQHNQKNKTTKLILPVGPTGQYPVLADLLNQNQVNLSNCWFFFMDEYCTVNFQALPTAHPLSFKRIADQHFFSQLSKDLNLNPDQVYFPDKNNIENLAQIIEKTGGIDTCYGGIGIHGHIAFNEPTPGIKQSGPRLVELNDFTRTINAIRTQVGGNLENFPTHAFTLGMQEILNARRIRLYCRNGTPYDWANTILRIALLGEPGDDYPVTHIRNHPEYLIITDKETLQTPKYIL